MSYCSNCGTPAREGASFCFRCGKMLPPEDPPAPAVALPALSASIIPPAPAALSPAPRVTGYAASPPGKRRDAPGDSWFMRHPNWTMFLTWVCCLLLTLLVAINGASDWAWPSLLFPGPIILAVGCWGLRAKGQNIAWALVFLIPLGWIVILALENKRDYY